MRYIIIFILLLSPLFTCQAEEALTTEMLKEQAISYRQEGYRLQAAGDLEGALIFYQKAAQIDPLYVEVYNDIGVVYEGLGDAASALAMYKRALELDPNYLSTYTNLAFFYETQGNIREASYYWQKRYELGKPGEYWWEVSRQHLLKLGTYPQVRKDILERDAARLSRELVYVREQQRLQDIEEAKLHLDIGANLLRQGDYAQALKEFETALSLDPTDQELKKKIIEYYNSAEEAYTKEQALINTQDALNYIKNNDFLSAGDKLKDALTAVFRIAQEK